MINKQSISDLVKKEAELETRLQIVQTELAKERALFAQANKNSELYKQCTDLLVNTSLSIQKKTTDKIAKIVTSMYQYVFLSDDVFGIQIDTKRSVPVASFYIETKKGGKTIRLNPLKSDGGGKTDVISLGLRLAALLLYRPALQRVLFLDEPMRFLSTTSTSAMPYRVRAAEFLKQIAEEYRIQLIVVTHDAELAGQADQIYDIHLDDNGYAVVTNDTRGDTV